MKALLQNVEKKIFKIGQKSQPIYFVSNLILSIYFATFWFKIVLTAAAVDSITAYKYV